MLFKEYYQVGDAVPEWLSDRIGNGEAILSEDLSKEAMAVSVVTMDRSIPCHSFRGDYVLLSDSGGLVPCHKIMFDVLFGKGLIGGTK